MIIIQSPKQRWRKSEFSKPHSLSVTQTWMQAALDAALLQLIYESSKAQDMGVSAANNFRLEGARWFKDIFLTLSEPEPKTKPDRGDSLPEDLM